MSEAPLTPAMRAAEVMGTPVEVPRLPPSTPSLARGVTGLARRWTGQTRCHEVHQSLFRSDRAHTTYLDARNEGRSAALVDGSTSRLAPWNRSGWSVYFCLME